jgi:hypothetical protein
LFQLELGLIFAYLESRSRRPVLVPFQIIGYGRSRRDEMIFMRGRRSGGYQVVFVNIQRGREIILRVEAICHWSSPGWSGDPG